MTDGSVNERFQLVRLANGEFSIHSAAENETFHPVAGPVAEARALYVDQLELRRRITEAAGETFVVWDVGLGAAGNVLTALRSASDLPAQIEVVSFDRTLEPLALALRHAKELEYLRGFEPWIAEILSEHFAGFEHGALRVRWLAHLGAFPEVMRHAAFRFAEHHKVLFPPPHVILFDPFSPSKNPEMWTVALFQDMRSLLAPGRPCALATFSRSTRIRLALLGAGWHVGRGNAVAGKEETTIAANSPGLIARPLDRTWFERVARACTSRDAQETPELSRDFLGSLETHPQFAR